MAPAPTARRPSRNGSSEHVLPHKHTTKRGLKRRASTEAVNPRERKRARRDEPGAFSLTQRPWQSHVVSVSNSQKRPSHDTFPKLFVWGCGDDGSLGLGPDYLEEIPRPRPLHLGQTITSIAAGGLYTLLLDKDGKVSTSPPFLRSHNLTVYAQVWSCGNNDDYALGRETESAKRGWATPHLSFDELISRPDTIPGLGSHNISSISTGNELSAAVTVTGELFIWGAVRVSSFHLSLPHNEPTGG